MGVIHTDRNTFYWSDRRWCFEFKTMLILATVWQRLHVSSAGDFDILCDVIKFVV